MRRLREAASVRTPPLPGAAERPGPELAAVIDGTGGFLPGGDAAHDLQTLGRLCGGGRGRGGDFVGDRKGPDASGELGQGDAVGRQAVAEQDGQAATGVVPAVPATGNARTRGSAFRLAAVPPRADL